MLTSIHFFLTLYLILLPLRPRLTTTVVYIVGFVRLLQPHFGRTIQVSYLLLFLIPFSLSVMKLSIMFVIGFLFDKFQVTKYAFKALSEMNDFDMSIKMMFVPENHYTVIAFVFFFICMRNHMSFQMRPPFE